MQFLKISINELLLKYSENKIDLGSIETIVVYDMQSEHTNQLDPDHSFACILLRRLASKYHSVSFLTGGLLTFQQAYPHLCQSYPIMSTAALSTTTQIVPIVVVHSNSTKNATTIEEEDNSSSTTTTVQNPNDLSPSSSLIRSLSSSSSSTLSVKSTQSGAAAEPTFLNMKPRQNRLFCHSLSTFGLNLSSTNTNSTNNNNNHNNNTVNESTMPCSQNTNTTNNISNNNSNQIVSSLTTCLSSSSSSSSSSNISSLASSSLGSFNYSSAAMHGIVAGLSSGGDDETSNNSNKPNKGPTKILDFLYLGSQEDSLSEQTLKVSSVITALFLFVC